MIDRDRFRTLSIQQMQQVIATICGHLEPGMPRSFQERLNAILSSGGEDEKFVEGPWAPEKCLEREELARFLYNLKPGDRLRINWLTSPYHGRSCQFVRETYRSHFGAQYVHEWAGVVRFADGEEKEFGPCLVADESLKAATRLEALAFKVAAAQPKESAEAIKQWAQSLAGDLTAAGEVEYSPESFPKPDPTIIHAAEGVVLEPGEYEVVAISILDSMPKLAVGGRFEIKERAVATTDGYFRIPSAVGRTWVIAARRVSEDPSQKPDQACGCWACLGKLPKIEGEVFDSRFPEAEGAARDSSTAKRKLRTFCAMGKEIGVSCCELCEEAFVPVTEAQPAATCAMCGGAKNLTCSLCHGDWDGDRMSCMCCDHGKVVCPVCKGTGRAQRDAEPSPEQPQAAQIPVACAIPVLGQVMMTTLSPEAALRNMGLGGSFARPFHSEHRHVIISMICEHCHNSSADYLQSVSEDRLQHYWEHHSKCEEQPVEGAQNKAPNHYGRVVARAEPFPNGTPEAARDALLRASLFDCVVDAGPQTTWHYHYALQIITAYRNELTAENTALRERIETMERENRYHEGMSAEQWFRRWDKANEFRAEAEAQVVKLEKRCESYKSDAAWYKSGREQSDREVDTLTEKLTTVQRARDEAHVACDRAERLHEREAKPWEAIARWASRPSQLDSSITLTFPLEDEHRFHAELTSGTVLCVSKYGETRQQAFALLAEWCESALKGNGGDNG